MLTTLPESTVHLDAILLITPPCATTEHLGAASTLSAYAAVLNANVTPNISVRNIKTIASIKTFDLIVFSIFSPPV